MSDIFTKAKRSAVMARIRSRGNQATELVLAALFRRHRITGWRRHVQISVCSSQRELAHSLPPGKSRKALVGADSRRLLRVRPDFVFLKSRLAVFVDGCFWHGCPRHATQPKSNRPFWRKKLAGNRARDRRVNRALRRAGWQVLRIWEHALRRATLRRAATQRDAMQRDAKDAGNEVRLLRRIQSRLR